MQLGVTRYLSAEAMTEDDFGVPFTNEIGEVIFDAQIVTGQWATMTQTSWQRWAKGCLGVGRGQKYQRNAQGQLILVAGAGRDR